MAGPRLTALGAVLRQAVVRRRYENTVADRVRTIVERALDRVVREVLARPLDLVTPGRQDRRLASVLRAANEIVTDAYRVIYRTTKEEISQYGAVSTAKHAQNIQRFMGGAPITLDVHVALPTRAQLIAVITTNPMDGYPLRDWYGKQAKDLQASLRREMTIGYTRGETVDQLVTRIRGRSVGRGRFSGGLLDAATRHAEGIARTAVNHMDTQAALLTYAANEDVLEGVEFCATLDERTCSLCASLDGTVWPVGDPTMQAPPLHINDRCTLLPVIRWSAVGAAGHRSPPRTTYEEWFRAQPAGHQDLILGPSRARLVRSGARTLSDLVRDDGTRATLAELESDAA